MTALAWTTDAPTVAGIYFYDNDAMSCVKYRQDDGGQVRFHNGREEPIRRLRGKWLGPIDPERIVRMDAALMFGVDWAKSIIHHHKMTGKCGRWAGQARDFIYLAALDDAKVSSESPNSPTGQG